MRKKLDKHARQQGTDEVTKTNANIALHRALLSPNLQYDSSGSYGCDMHAKAGVHRKPSDCRLRSLVQNKSSSDRVCDIADRMFVYARSKGGEIVLRDAQPVYGILRKQI